MTKILLVEDDVALAGNIRQWLEFEHHVVDHFTDGSHACERLRDADYDLIILDWQLPGTAGPDICRAFRAAGGKSPVLFLTGMSQLTNKIAGFEAGADDYLTKPFHAKELTMRVSALLRRAPSLTSCVLSAGDISIDSNTGEVTKNGSKITLQPREYQVLEFLLSHKDQCFDSEYLLKRVWPVEVEAGVEAVKTIIKKLRKKIDPEGTLLVTRHGFGYMILSEPGTVAADE